MSTPTNAPTDEPNFAPSAATRPNCPDDANGTPLDIGSPVLIGQGRHYYWDGSYETHNGLEPVRAAPPADPVRRQIHKLAYHRAKFRAADAILRQLRAVLRPGTSFTFDWDQRVIAMFGPPPRTAEAAEARMSLVTEWHAEKVRLLEARLRERGIDLEGADV